MTYKDAWGYSKIACYFDCPQKFKFQFIDKRPSGSSPAMERGAALHQSCEAYLNGWDTALDAALSNWQEQLDKLKANNCVAEKAWGFNDKWELLPDWLHPTTWLRAKSDAHYLAGTKLVIIDFKSGKYKPPPIEQIELYAICGHAVYPEVTEVITEFWFLDQDKVYSTSYTAAHLLILRDKYASLVAPIYVDETWEAQPSRDCAWCAYSKTKGGPCVSG